MEEKGRSRRRFGIAIATVILAAVVFVALWLSGLVPLGLSPPGDQPSETLDGLTVQSGEELVLSLVDMEGGSGGGGGVGWELLEENEVSLQADGFRDGFLRKICSRDPPPRGSLCWEVTALVFGSSAAADAYFGSAEAEAYYAQYTTEERQHGDDAIYWGKGIIVRWRNVVWVVLAFCELVCPFGSAEIDWIADELISKVNLVAP